MSTTYCPAIAPDATLDSGAGFSPESNIVYGFVTMQTDGSLFSLTQLTQTARLMNYCITQLSRLEDDWDSSDALAPTPPIVNAMSDFVRLLDRRLFDAGTDWQKPTCFATPTGGIELFWRGTQFHLSALVEPEEGDTVIVLYGDGVTRSKLLRLSAEEAAGYVMNRLCDREAGR